MLVRTAVVSGQLVGHRGLVQDWVYHDNLTLAGQLSLPRSSSLSLSLSLVSKTAGRLAQELEVLEKHRESERRILELQGRERLAEPRYDQQESQENLLGQEVAAQSVLAYGDSLYLQPVENTRWVSRLSSLVL